MSIDICKDCGDFVDTDAMPESYVLKPNYTNTAMPVNPKAIEKDEWFCVCSKCQEQQGIGEFSDD